MILRKSESSAARLSAIAFFVSWGLFFSQPARAQAQIQSSVIPFVGCKSDGQTGPVAAPKVTSKSVALDKKVAQKLAYYEAAMMTASVLAPRGWHCFETYGSSGATLFVTPQPLKKNQLFSTKGIEGPAIQFSVMSGDTSGRFTVAAVIARVFPAHKAFVTQVIGEGIEPASEFPEGSYPADKLTYLNDQTVEYQTPQHAEGLGTQQSKLASGDLSIAGFATLMGQTPDLGFLAVRLSDNMGELSKVIIKHAEIESKLLSNDPE